MYVNCTQVLEYLCVCVCVCVGVGVGGCVCFLCDCVCAQVIYGAGNDRFGGCGSILSVHETGCGACGR